MTTSSGSPVGYHRELTDLLARLYATAGRPSLRALSEEAKVSTGHLSGILNGSTLPSPETARAIARALKAQPAVQQKAYDYADRARQDRSATRTGGRGSRTAREQEHHLTLEEYLADVIRHAEGTSEPYVPQSVVLRHDGRPADRATARPAYTAVFSAGPLAVVLGEPGGGKSELLRRHRLDICRQWHSGDRSAALPVLVPAAAFSETALEAPLFARPPARGRRWLVLLDSLDEITDAQARRKVLRRAVRWVARRPKTHRLVVATRHLSAQERGDLGGADLEGADRGGAAPVCFELLRFEAGDVRELAAAWLAPDQVDGLMRAIDEAGLADLVKLPMIGAILCQLYRADPDRPLGNTRGDIYDAFVIQLMATTPRTETLPEHHAGERDDMWSAARLGTEVAEHIEALCKLPPPDLRTLLTRVVARRRESGPVRSVVDVLMEEPLTRPLDGVPRRWWRGQLVACFRRSGVLEQRGEELEFAHRTYEEFLAACAACDPPERGLEELRRVLGAHRRMHLPGRPVPGYRAVGTWGRRLWSAAADDGQNMSYLGFLIDRLADAAEADLGKLASAAGISGCTFLAAQKRLGTYLPAEVQTQAVKKLKRHIKVGGQALFGASIDVEAVNQLDPGSAPMAEALAAMAIDDSRVDAGVALLAFAETRADGLAALRDLARSPRLTSLQGRVAAASAIFRAGDDSGLDLIVELAGDPELDPDVRLGIAWRLTDLRRQRGLDLLDSWIDARAGGLFWFHAALMVVGIDEAYGIERMKSLTDDSTCPVRTRVNAAVVVALHKDPRGTEDLLRFARDRELEESLRVAAVHFLAKAGHPSAPAVRDELAQEPDLTARSRKDLRRLPAPE
ncbi:helix-turn-helix domain-containing protein [Streptomyces griseosporeus]|uniref:helix-turn-helix domain-containing protein n=1 Tax=Streptomyces griseosporeus TaxID=1910 RepID=UPI0036F4D6B1